MSSEDTTLSEIQQELRQLQAEYRKILRKVSDLEDKVELENIHGSIDKE